MKEELRKAFKAGKLNEASCKCGECPLVPDFEDWFENHEASTVIKTLQECKDEVCENLFKVSFNAALALADESDLHRIVNEVAKAYYLQPKAPVKVAIPLIRLTEMSGDHFSRIFTEGFAPSFMKEIIQAFKSLYGFHTAISEYGKFDSHRLAFELGYDVEFTLDQPEWMRKQLTGE